MKPTIQPPGAIHARRAVASALMVALLLSNVTALPRTCDAAPADAMLLSQRGTFTPGGSSPGASDPLIDFDNWILEVAMTLLAFLTAMVFGFVVIYRRMLSISNPYWPLTAYGFCLSFVLFVTFGVALAVFWEDLVLDNKDGPVTAMMVWGGRAGLVSAGTVLIAIVLSIFRSPYSRKASAN